MIRTMVYLMRASARTNARYSGNPTPENFRVRHEAYLAAALACWLVGQGVR